MSSMNSVGLRKRSYDECISSDDECQVVRKKHRKGPYVLRKLKKLYSWISEFPASDFFVSITRMGTIPEIVLSDDDDEENVPINDNRHNKSEPSKHVASHFEGRNALSREVRQLNNFVTLAPRKNHNVDSEDTDELSRNSSMFSDRTQRIVQLSMKEKKKRKMYKMQDDYQKEAVNPFRVNPRPPLRKEKVPARISIDGRRPQNNTTLNGTRLWSRACKLTPIAKSTPFLKNERIAATSLRGFLNSEKDDLIAPDRKENADDDDDGIEFIKAVASPKQSSGASSGMNGTRRSSFSKRPMAKRQGSSFTAHDVVRLQEKAQYQKLLDECASRNVYQPVVKRPTENQPTKTSTCSKRKAFTKETLTQPITNYLQKYMLKPRQSEADMETEVKKSSLKTEGDVVIIDDDNDDDIVILDMKLPAVKPRTRSKSSFFSPEWISELRTSITEETSERMKAVEEQNVKIRDYRKRKAALQAAERIQRDSLKIKGIVMPETISLDEDLSADYPELTPEMEVMIDDALVNSPPNEVLCSLKGNHQVLRKDMDTLSGLSWLNDEIINYYMALIVERGKLDNYPSVYAFNSFFYPTLKSKGYSAVRRWTRKVDIFSHDINLVPLHLGLHWCLAVIDHRHKTIQYFDSMLGGELQCLEVLRDYLIDEMRDKKKSDLNTSCWSLEPMKNIPQQMNGSDCGMFTLKYAEYITRNAEITFTQKNMQYFRRRMVYEILTNQLL